MPRHNTAVPTAATNAGRSSRRDLDRMYRLTERSWNDDRAARNAAQRAETTTRACQDARNIPRAVQATIERLETKHRQLTGWIEARRTRLGARDVTKQRPPMS